MRVGGGRAVGVVAAVAGGRWGLARSMAAGACDGLASAGIDEADEAVRGTCEDASVCKR